MKKCTSILKLSLIHLAVLTAFVLMNACSTPSKSAAAPPPEPEPVVAYSKQVITPCTGPEYRSDSAFLRFSAVGESMDQMVAKEKAMQSARTGLARQIEVNLKSNISSYLKSQEYQNEEELRELFEQIVDEYSIQTMHGAKPICDVLLQNEDNKYQYYVSMEIENKGVAKSLMEAASKEDKLNIEMHREQFQKFTESIKWSLDE
jgi:hypothetical protein